LKLLTDPESWDPVRLTPLQAFQNQVVLSLFKEHPAFWGSDSPPNDQKPQTVGAEPTAGGGPPVTRPQEPERPH